MTPLDHAVRDITRVLESLRIAYAIIGGIANAVWGEPRATIDVDVTIAVDEAICRRRFRRSREASGCRYPIPSHSFSRRECCRSIPLTASEST